MRIPIENIPADLLDLRPDSPRRTRVIRRLNRRTWPRRIGFSDSGRWAVPPYDVAGDPVDADRMRIERSRTES